jgi:nucleotide-binding universal stress UspA family protein
MKKRMKILIGYDGSECATAALDGLTRAGLPDEAEAMVVSVAEHWLFPLPIQETSQAGLVDSFEVLLEESQAMAGQAAARVRTHFPSWDLHTEADVGSPATVLLESADEWRPDLIVVGSHGHTALGRFVLGSISQKVATEAHCSVRIGRGRAMESNRPIRVLIGADGSPGSEAAVRAVAARTWPKETEVRLITLEDTSYNVARAEVQYAMDRQMQKRLAIELKEAGLNVSFRVEVGDPRHWIVKEADDWRADSIFLGARGLSKVKRFLLGSVSAAVAARAHCSVEIVRAEQAGC